IAEAVPSPQAVLVKVLVAVKLAMVPVVGDIAPLMPLQVTPSPFITVGLIATLLVFIANEAVIVEVPAIETEVGEAVTFKSMRGLASKAPAPVWQPVSLGKPSQPHQLFSTVATDMPEPCVACAMPEPVGAVLLTIRHRLTLTAPDSPTPAGPVMSI